MNSPNAGYHALLLALIVLGIGAFFVVMPVIDFQVRSRLKEHQPTWYRAAFGIPGLGLFLFAFYIWVVARFW